MDHFDDAKEICIDYQYIKDIKVQSRYKIPETDNV